MRAEFPMIITLHHTVINTNWKVVDKDTDQTPRSVAMKNRHNSYVSSMSCENLRAIYYLTTRSSSETERVKNAP